MNRQEACTWGEKQLQVANIDDWKTDAWLLMEYVANISRAEFFLRCHEEMSEKEWKNYESAIKQRVSHIPLQYITGIQKFMGLEFKVDKNVLIPRFDTENLVLEVEKHLSLNAEVLDMCTGSGCIAVSLKKRNEFVKVTAVDVSEGALGIAKENSKRLDADVSFLQSDLFEVFKKSEKLRKFDVIVSNPPYIPTPVIDGLEEEVKVHEPRLALDGTDDGLEFYRKITRESKFFLKKDGMLFYEIGHDQAEAVSAIMLAEGFVNIHVIKDLAGLDRVVYGGMKNV